MDSERITSLLVPEDPKRQDDLFRQAGEIRQRLWREHLATLTGDERRMIEEGKHPSQSHARAAAARAILDEFKARYGALPYVADIDLGMYHADRIVFMVNFNRKVPWQEWQKDIPLIFRGFEIKAGFPEKWEPTTARTVPVPRGGSPSG